jgi:segregation and condensation protein B
LESSEPTDEVFDSTVEKADLTELAAEAAKIEAGDTDEQLDLPEDESADVPEDMFADLPEDEPEDADMAAEASADGEAEEMEIEVETDAEAEVDLTSDTRDVSELARDIEAILFISPDPVSLDVLGEVVEAEGEELAHAVEAVREKFSDPEGGILFAEVAGGYTFRSGDLSQRAVERFCRRPVDFSLSPAAMETLAIVAYLQPVTRPEIARIRGVGADTVVGTLLDKGLLMEAGRSEETGAIYYRTTASFEKLFGLADLGALPQLEGFEASTEDVEELREKLYLAAEKRSV